MGRFVHVLRRDIPVDRVELAASSLMLMPAGGNLPTSTDPERDALDVATRAEDDLVPRPVFGLSHFKPLVMATLPEVADSRVFHPEQFDRPAKTVRGSRTALVAGPPRGSAKSSTVPVSVQFRNAGSVIPCIRRHARRASILAKGHGGAHYVERKRKPDSDVEC